MKLKLIVVLIVFFSGFNVIQAANPDLDPEEKKTVEIFHKYAPKVVFVHRYAKSRHPLALKKRVSAGSGSGIIWDNKGHIVTNYHVIQGAVDLAVTVNQITVPAKIIGVAPHRDLAVLQVTAPELLPQLKSFSPFSLAKTSKLDVGQKAIAIGNPFGLDHSLSMGIISALGRQIPGATGVKIDGMIQTDAAVNPGNSGGPLLDSRGRLIGINTSIFSNTGSSAGIGFAVPADDIAVIVPKLIGKGRLSLAGIGIKRIDPQYAEERLGVTKGVVIERTLPHSPAEKAGLHKSYRDKLGRVHIGDIIVGLNGHSVADYDELYHLFLPVKPGNPVTINIKRQGKMVKVKMKTVDIAAFKI